MAFGIPIAPLTSELDAVNMVMKAKGLDLVTSVDLSDGETADSCYHLDVADKEVQSRGWWFNKDYCLSLSLDSNGKIPLPAGTLSVAPSYYNYQGLANQFPFVERGGFLWDLFNHTFVFTSPQLVDITVRQDFTAMPEVARRYIAMLGAHRAQGLDRGNQTTLTITNQMVLQALTALEWEQDKAQPNNQVHDNISVQGSVNGFGGMARSRIT